jgi:hypothetical protein
MDFARDNEPKIGANRVGRWSNMNPTRRIDQLVAEVVVDRPRILTVIVPAGMPAIGAYRLL